MNPEWEPESECRIGSVPWFAGVFWLALSFPLSGLARTCAKLYLFRLAHLFLDASQWTVKQATKCALEGGAKI